VRDEMGVTEIGRKSERVDELEFLEHE
jgi:hypothetical protein